MLILCPGHAPFVDNWAAPLYRALARRVRTLYVHPDPSRFSLSGRSPQRLPPPRPERVEEVRLRPRLPGSRWTPVARCNRWLGLRSLVARANREAPGGVVLLSLHPDPVAGRCGAALRVYGIADNYSALSPEPGIRRRVERRHRRLLAQADLVWTTAASLARGVREVRPDVLESSNGVDFEAFVAGSRAPTPPALTGCPRPRVGLVGRLNDRIDWALLEELCRRRPGYNVVVVGPLYEEGEATRRALRRLESVANFRRLEGIPAERMPEWVGAFDVCLIPYALTPATLDINPLKLYQALAAGRPVVSTPLPATEPFRDTIEIRPDASGFAAAIDRALAASGEEAEARRRERVRGHDWQAIADTQLEWIRDALAARRA